MRVHSKRGFFLHAAGTARVVAIAICALTPAFALEGQVSVRDSLGVQIVATDGQHARAASQIRVPTQPELQIGVVDGDPGYVFSRIGGVALVPGERIAVVDGGSAELRFYDAQGGLMSRRGRSGQGPGEFQNPRLLNTVAGDSLVLFDGSTRRFTLYSSDGEGFRTLAGAGLGPGSARATSGARALMVSAAPVPMRETRGVFLVTQRVRLVDLGTGTADTMAVTPAPQVAVATPDFPLPTFMTAPYTFLPVIAAREDRFFMTTPNEPSVLEYSWNGELRRIIRLIEPLNRVTDAELSAAIEREVDRFLETRDAPRAIVRSAFDGLEPPEAEPTFRSLIVDDVGWLWAQAYQVSAGDARTWLLFDSDGRGRGSVEMPRGLSVSAISRDHVAGVWRDELGVEYVRVHRVEGRP